MDLFDSFQEASPTPQIAPLPANPPPQVDADFGFSAFTSAPANPVVTPQQPALVDPFSASFGVPAGAPQLVESSSSAGGWGSTPAQQKKDPFADLASKSGLWADALSKGLVDLNISNSGL